MNVTKTSFECKRDDLTIRGLTYQPETEGKLPVAIISHGFMANHTSVIPYAKQFAEWGYLAICYDFNGGCVVGMSDGATTDMSVLTEVEDLKAVIEYARSLDQADLSRLILMGCSQGGFVSALTAVQPGIEVSKLILFYPALCIPDDARRGEMVAAHFDPKNIPDVIDCGPMKLGRVYPEAVLEMDPFEEIKGYAGPTLIVHGTCDGLVNVSYAKKAYEAYTGGDHEAHPEKQLVLIDGADHGFTEEYDPIAIEAVRRFI